MQPSKAWIIGDTIEKNKRVFKIPVYQRNYSWNNTQCEKLYEDLLNAFRSDKKHFTGTIVYITGERSSSSLSEDMIIDGQQRITTIFILLKAMLDIAVSKGDSLVSELNDLLFNRNCPPEFRLKLEPVQADLKQFQALMNGNEDAYDNNSLVIRNYQLFRKMITASLNEGMLLSDILEGLKHLEIVELVLDKSQGDEPQVIFESINSTGLDLSLADKIRNFLLMDDVRQKELYEKYWLVLESRMGQDELADYFVLFISRLLPDKVPERDAYRKFCKFVRNRSLTHEYLLQELTRYSRYYAAFVGRPNHYSDEINRVLGDLRALDQSTPYIFLLDVFDDFEQKCITEEELLRVLRFIRNYSLRRVVCEYRSGALAGMYKSLYAKLFKDGQKQDGSYYARVFSFFNNNNSNLRLISDSDFKDALLYRSLYSKKKACRFLLTALENNQSKEQLRSDELTIEHVLPQKEGVECWVKEIGRDDYEVVYSKYLHTLGNLTITGYNSELGAKEFKLKKEFIAQHSKAQILNKDILAVDQWNEEAILKRAKRLADRTVELFAFEQVSNDRQVVKTDDEQWLSLGDRERIDNVKPVEYLFYGESREVNNWTDMLLAVMNSLYERDNTIMERLVSGDCQMSSEKWARLATDKSVFKKGKEIGNSGIFFETKLNASLFVKFIANIIEFYNLDPDEFSFRVIQGAAPKQLR